MQVVMKVPGFYGDIELPNPRYQPGHPEELQKVVVRRALRDDPLGRLHARSQIGEAQYMAGRDWQALWEGAAVGGSVRSIDFTQTPVDGNPPRNGPISDHQQKCMRELMRLDRALGQEGCMVVRYVLADRATIAAVAMWMGIGDERYWGIRFRECLTTLAKELGYRT